jgi:large subunit ribosomal protein L15
MQIHELKSIKKKRQRIGRSGKRGSYSGRGVKGQKSRSGRRLRPAERDLILRLPKQRGFANMRKTDTVAIFNVGDLSVKLKSFVKGSAPLELNRQLLVVAGLLQKDFKGKVKLLGTGEAAFPMNVTGLTASGSATIKIRKAGGSVAAQ